MTLLSSLLGVCVVSLVAPAEPTATEPAVTHAAPTLAPVRLGTPVAPTLAPIEQSPAAPASQLAPPELSSDGSASILAPAEPTAAAPAIPPPASLRPGLAPPPGLAPRPIFVTAPPRTTRAAAPRDGRVPRGWAIDVSAGTSVPISAGAALQVEAPPRLLGQVELGGLPGAYVDLQNLLLRGGGDPSAAIARGASRRAFVVRAALGVRPLRRRGLELRGGYTGALLGQDATTLATIGAAADADLQAADRDVLVQSTLHGIHADVGWRWVVRGHILVRAALGYVHSLGARLHLVPDPKASEEETRRVDVALGDVADAAATTAVRSPLLTLHLGYRF